MHRDAATPPSEMASTLQMVRDAYPNGVSGDELEILGAILKTRMSIRNIAGLIVDLGWGDYSYGYNLASGFDTSLVAQESSIKDRVMARLTKGGFSRWDPDR